MDELWGEYREIKEIARGGMARVLLIEHKHSNEQFAAKLPLINETDESKRRQINNQFNEEKRIHPRLNNDYIVSCYGVHENPQGMRLQYVEGNNLRQYLAQLRDGKKLQDVRDIALKELKTLVDHITEALTAVHFQEWCHCDIKPENILRSSEGKYFLTDFGIAHQKDLPLDYLRGTPKYMAPEQVDPSLGTINERTDVYSFAITIYEMLVDRVPFVEYNNSSLLEQHLRYIKPPRITYFDDSLPAQVNDVMMTALSRDHNQRYQSVEEFQEKFAKVMFAPDRKRRPAKPDKPPKNTILVCTNDDCDKEKIKVRPEMLIGRNDECDIPIKNDLAVSRRHTLLEWSNKEQGFEVWHQGWARETRVNGNPVLNEAPKYLRDGDLLTIGSSNYRLDVPS